MKLLFKQRFFSWFDSYDIYNEAGEVMFQVKGQFSWGKKLEIYDASGAHVGTLEQKLFEFFPAYELFLQGKYVGTIRKVFSFFTPSFEIDCNGWCIDGDWMEWDYEIVDPSNMRVASISKEIFNWTDTYVLDIRNPADMVTVLMIALAIDAEKESRD